MAIPPTQTVVTSARSHFIVTIGDSITYRSNSLMNGYEHYTEVMAAKLRTSTYGANVRGINMGISGNTTTQMLARISSVTSSIWGIPDIVVIYGGINDPGNGISDATTTANLKAMIDALYTAGVRKMVLMGMHFMHWSVGGDTTITQAAARAALDVDVQAAVTYGTSTYPSATFVFQNNYTLMKNIVGNSPAGSNVITVAEAATSYTIGADHTDSTPAFSSGKTFSWHVADSDVHLNQIGQQVLANSLVTTINAQTGWIAAIT